MYTIDKSEAQVGENGLFQDDKQLIIAGPYAPQVIHDYAQDMPVPLHLQLV